MHAQQLQVPRRSIVVVLVVEVTNPISRITNISCSRISIIDMRTPHGVCAAWHMHMAPYACMRDCTPSVATHADVPTAFSKTQ